MTVWYEDGIRFRCTGCGGCCVDRGDYAYVFLREGEERALARALELTAEAFLERFTQDVDGFVALVNRGDRCVFLGDEGCLVYRARPGQCRTWPFWPENLERRVWKGEVQPGCPGVGKGRLYPADQVDRIAFESRTARLLKTREAKSRG